MVPDVAVIGSGIIGCAAAYYLARAGLSVIVIDRVRLGGEASMAAAGMLAPYCEYDYRDPPEFMPMCVRGYREHLWLAEALREEIGVNVGLRKTGFIYLSLAYQGNKATNKYHALKARGAPVKWLTQQQLLCQEPHLAADVVQGGMLCEEESVVDTLRLVQGLRTAALRRGVRMVPYSGFVETVSSTPNTITIRTTSGLISAGFVVIAAGRLSSEVGKQFGLDLPTIPVRGQMAVLQGSQPPFRHVIYIPDGGCGSLISRSNGRVVLGTTEEYGNDGNDVTLDGLQAFAKRAIRIAPLLADMPILRAWSGLRPCGPDRMPMIGRANGHDRVVVATGHYRNGILLGPLTGLLVTQLVTDTPLAVDLTRFDPCRHHQPHETYCDQL